MCGGGGGYEEKEPASKLALAQQAATSLQRYGEIFVPLENAFIQDSLNAFGDSGYESAQGQSSTNIAAMYEQKLPAYEQQMFQGGIDPTSGAYGGKIDSIRAAQARSMGQGASQAGIGRTDNAYRGLQNVVRAGQGLQTEAMQGNVSRMNDQMALAGTQAESDFQDRSQTAEIAGTVAGAAGGMYANKSRA
tara:strand:- start:2271 stop:2843 length:573 start_codon:yes stop_codon:yes gene_type:complete